MNFQRTSFRTSFLGAIGIATFLFVAIPSRPSFADNTLNCSNTVSGSTQQGAICLPADPTGVSNSIPTSNQSVSGVIILVIQIALTFSLVLAIAMVIFGGYRYIFSAGNEEATEAGKKTVINALIGIVIILLSYTIVAVVSNSAQNLSGSGTDVNSADVTPAAPSN